MYKILIDTTDRYHRSVILTKDNKTIDSIEGDIDIVVEIKNILSKNNLKMNEIEEIAPNTGPGSFTGIKTGVTVANIINWAKEYSLGGKNPKQYIPNYGAKPNIDKSRDFTQKKK